MNLNQNIKKEILYVDAKVLLTLVNQEDIYCKYFGFDKIKYNKLYKSFIRNDKHPSCSFAWFGNKLRFCDWATGKFLDVFELLQITTGKSFIEVCNIIYEDFLKNQEINKEHLLLLTNKNNMIDYSASSYFIGSETNNHSKINVVYFDKNFPKEFIDYWSQYSISVDTLIKYNVKPIKEAYINDKLKYVWHKQDIGIVYFFPDKTKKLYFPNRKINRFFGNSSYIQGWNNIFQNDNLCVITKSLKDVMIYSELGIDAIAPPSETVILNKEYIDTLESYYENIVINYDPDRQGRASTIKYDINYNLKLHFFAPKKVKDISGAIKKYGIDNVADYVANKYKIINSV